MVASAIYERLLPPTQVTLPQLKRPDLRAALELMLGIRITRGARCVGPLLRARRCRDREIWSGS